MTPNAYARMKALARKYLNGLQASERIRLTQEAASVDTENEFHEYITQLESDNPHYSLEHCLEDVALTAAVGASIDPRDVIDALDVIMRRCGALPLADVKAAFRQVACLVRDTGVIWLADVIENYPSVFRSAK